MVTADPHAARLARAEGAGTVADHVPPRGMNAAVRLGTRALAEAGAEAALILMADLPLARPADLEAVLAAAPPGPGVTLVPSRDGTGTNALLVRPPAALAPRLGPGSLARHRAGAARRGLRAATLERPALGLDVDTPGGPGRLPGRRPARRDPRGVRRSGPVRAPDRGGAPLRLWTLPGLPEVRPGDDLDGLLAEAAARLGHGRRRRPGGGPQGGEQGRGPGGGPGPRCSPDDAARALADESGKDPRLCALILAESRRIVRRRRGTLICETHHGFVCANAGIDASNAPEGHVILLPRDPDASARRLQARLAARLGGRVGVVITDTHGRAFRRGLVNVAIGVAGFRGLVDHRGGRDREGRLLVATDEALADELAAAAGALQAKGGGLPAVVVSGVSTEAAPGGVGELLRDPAHDLFRG